MLAVLFEFNSLFLSGFLTTLKLLSLIVLIGVPLGIVFGVVGARYSVVAGDLLKMLKFFTKVVPVLVLLFWFHFPLQSLLNIVINPFWTTVVALGFVNFVSIAYLIQTELQLFPYSYREAGVTLGLTKAQVVRYVELPIMFRRVVPDILLTQSTMLEYTLFASLISVPELFRVAQTVNSIIYDPVATYSILVLFFIMILAPIHILSTYLQKKYQIQYV